MTKKEFETIKKCKTYYEITFITEYGATSIMTVKTSYYLSNKKQFDKALKNCIISKFIELNAEDVEKEDDKERN